MRRLPAQTPIQDEVNGTNYRIKEYLGHGGFGTAYRAVELNNNGGEKNNSDTCLKIALRADEWHGRGILRESAQECRTRRRDEIGLPHRSL